MSAVPAPAGGARRRPDWLVPLAGAAVALAVWWALTAPFMVGNSVLADFAPGPALAAMGSLLRDGGLLRHVWLSLQRVLAGLALALAFGIPLGLVTGYVRALERATSLVFQFLRMVSPLSWVPIAVMVLGIGDRPVYFLVAMAAVWPILLNTQAGVLALERRWLLLARSVGASRWQALLHVVVPAVLPQMVTGLRLAVGLAWIVLVPAEMLGVTSGLGYFILDTRDRLAYSELMAAVLVIGSLGYLLDLAVRTVQARLQS